MGMVRKTMKILSWALGPVVVIFLLFPLALSDSFHVEREILMAYDDSLIFETVIDFSKRHQWDPWIKNEPDAVPMLLGTPGEVGSGWSWTGDEPGSGRVIIREMDPPRQIISSLEFYNSFDNQAMVYWDFTDSAGGTYVKWAVSGSLSYPFEKWMGLFYDTRVGADLERGLHHLQDYCGVIDAIPRQIHTGPVQIKETRPRWVLSMRTDTTMAHVIEVLDDSYKKILAYIRKNRSAVMGSPMALYANFIEETSDVTVEAILGVADSLESTEKISFRTMPPTRVVYAIHYGPYHTVSSTYDTMMQFIRARHLEVTGDAWEEYINNPATVDSDYQLQTIIYFPIK